MFLEVEVTNYQGFIENRPIRLVGEPTGYPTRVLPNGTVRSWGGYSVGDVSLADAWNGQYHSYVRQYGFISKESYMGADFRLVHINTRQVQVHAFVHLDQVKLRGFWKTHNDNNWYYTTFSSHQFAQECFAAAEQRNMNGTYAQWAERSPWDPAPELPRLREMREIDGSAIIIADSWRLTRDCGNIGFDWPMFDGQSESGDFRLPIPAREWRPWEPAQRKIRKYEYISMLSWEGEFPHYVGTSRVC